MAQDLDASEPGSGSPAAAGTLASIPDSTRMEITPGLAQALDELEQAVTGHDSTAFMAMVDPEYKRVEHDGFSQRNTRLFLDEFFCGKVLTAADLHFCLPFGEISALQRIGANKLPNALGVSTPGVVYIVRPPSMRFKAALPSPRSRGNSDSSGRRESPRWSSARAFAVAWTCRGRLTCSTEGDSTSS